MAGKSDTNTTSALSSTARLAKKSTLTFLTIGLLLMTGGGYYLHVLDQESYLISRNFRLLALWSKELTEKVSDYKNHFQYIISASNQKESYQDWDCSQGSPIKIGLAVPDSRETENRSSRHAPCPQKKMNAQSFKELVEEMGIKPKLTLVSGQLSDNTIAVDLLEFSTELRANDTLRLQYEEPNHTRTNQKENGQAHQSKFEAELSFPQLVDLIVTENIFDDLIIFDSTGKVHFQQNPSQFKFDNIHNLISRDTSTSFWDSLFSGSPSNPYEQQGPTNGSSSGAGRSLPHPTHRQITEGSISYELFTQPVLLPKFTVGHEGKAKGSSPRLILAGLVDSEKFQSRAYAIPYTWLLIFIFFVLFGFLSLPIIRLNLMDHRERLTPFNIVSLLLTSLVGTALLTVFCLDAMVFIKTRESLNTNLQKTAQGIKHRFDEELSAILTQLHHYNNSATLKEDFTFIRESPFDWTARQQIENPCRGITAESHEGLCYPDYDVVFWVNPNNKVKINWTRDAEPYLQGGEVSLAHRDYVKNVLRPERPLWRKMIHGHPLQFYAQPLISLGTGKRSVVISMPYSPPINQDQQRVTPGQWVSAIEQSFQSFHSLAIPGNTGFAVVEDESGDVVFHSDSNRSLRENFFEETDFNAQLQAYVFSRTAGEVKGEYLGIGHVFYTLPLNDVPWTIIVFRSKELFRTANFEALLLASTLFAVYAVVFYILAGWWLSHRLRHEKAPWFWPDYHHSSWYIVLMLLNLIHLLAGIGLFRYVVPPSYFLLFGLLYPPISLIFLRVELHFLGQRWKKPTDSAQNIATPEVQPKRIHRLYAGVMASFLLLVSAFPMGIFFKIGIDQEMTLAIKYNLSSLGRELLNSTELDLSPIRYSYSRHEKTFPLTQENYECRNSHTPRTKEGLRVQAPSHAFNHFSPSHHGIHLHTISDTRLHIGCELPNTLSTPRLSTLPVVTRIHQFIRARSLLSPISIETYGLIDDRPWDGHFIWPTSKSNQSTVSSLAFQMPVKGLSTNASGQTNPWVILQSTLPIHKWFFLETGHPYTPWTDLRWYLLGGGFVLAIGILPFFVISRIFPIPWKSTASQVLKGPDQKYLRLGKRNFLVVGLPGSGKSDLTQHFPEDQWDTIYLHVIGDPQELSRVKQEAVQSTKPGIILDHFEYQFGVSSFDQGKRELLEGLLAKDKQLCVLSTINPFKFQGPQPLALESSIPVLHPDIPRVRPGASVSRRKTGRSPNRNSAQRRNAQQAIVGTRGMGDSQ